MKERRRKHDDAHHPLAGRGQRGNTSRPAPNWGGVVVVERPRCPDCGQILPHGFFGCSKSDSAAQAA